MSQGTVGRWGKNLAVRVPLEIARASALAAGERVQIEAHDRNIVIRRPAAWAPADAEAIAEEVIDESRSYSLSTITIRKLIEEGRRG